jgi:hypothetical protein
MISLKSWLLTVLTNIKYFTAVLISVILAAILKSVFWCIFSSYLEAICGK